MDPLDAWFEQLDLLIGFKALAVLHWLLDPLIAWLLERRGSNAE